jgi:hypothetical protein
MRPPAIVLLAVLLAACSSRPSPAEPVLPVVEVTPPTGDKPHRISIAALPPNRESLRRALESSGIDLRHAGGRTRLAIRYMPLDLAAESRLLDAAGLDPDAFSEPRAFGTSDAIQVRSVTGDDAPIGFTLHLLPTGDETGFSGFEAGAMVRPERGTLLPVLRGRVPARRSGSVLLVGFAGDEPAFVTLVRLRIDGTEDTVRLRPATRHRVAVRLLRIPSRSLADTLAKLGLPERAGRLGLDAWVLDADKASRLSEVFSFAADDVDSVEILAPAEDGGAEKFAFGDARLWIFPRLDGKTYRYESRLWLGDAMRSPALHTHGVTDTMLLARWDHAGRDVTLVAVIRVTPLP